MEVTEVKAESAIFRPQMPTLTQMVATAQPEVLVPMASLFRKETQVMRLCNKWPQVKWFRLPSRLVLEPSIRRHFPLAGSENTVSQI